MSCFLLVLHSFSFLTHSSAALFPTENTTICLVFLRQELFFFGRDRTWHPGSGSTLWDYSSRQILIPATWTHGSLFWRTEAGGGWDSWFCTAHTQFAVCKAWGGAATFPRSQILLIGPLRGKTEGEGKQPWRTHWQMTLNCSNCSPVPQMYPLSSECLEILHWNDEHFGGSVHLTEQYLWQGEETEGRELCFHSINQIREYPTKQDTVKFPYNLHKEILVTGFFIHNSVKYVFYFKLILWLKENKQSILD